MLDYWIENEDLRHTYEQKYLDSAKNFNQKRCMQEMEEMMQKTIQTKKEN